MRRERHLTAITLGVLSVIFAAALFAVEAWRNRAVGNACVAAPEGSYFSVGWQWWPTGVACRIETAEGIVTYLGSDPIYSVVFVLAAAGGMAALIGSILFLRHRARANSQGV